jgi:aspartokinase-like uncharacterized kinase
MRNLRILFLLFLFSSCQPSTQMGCQQEAKKVIRRLISDLEDVQTTEDLMKLEREIKKKTETLVLLMIRLKKLESEKVEKSFEGKEELSERLSKEMERIYMIPGGRELVEAFQREALFRLDAFDQRRKK